MYGAMQRVSTLAIEAAGSSVTVITSTRLQCFPEDSDLQSLYDNLKSHNLC